MNPNQRLSAALTRIASASSVARARQDEAERRERRGDDGLTKRLDAVVARFESLADEMEAALS